MARVKFKVKKKYIVRRMSVSIIAILLIIGIIILVVSTRGYIATASTGSMSITEKYDAVIVRDEKVYTAPSFNRADYMVTEGEYVSQGMHVMDVYERGYSDELILSLQQTERELYAAQLEQLGETKDTALDGYNEAVKVLEERIAAAAMDDEQSTESVIRLEEQLMEILNERSEYLRTNLQQTETLRNLYAAIDQKKDMIEKSRTSLVSETSGTISFYFDDYENALNAEKLSIITSDIVKSAVNKNGAVGWTTKSETLAYRLVDTDEWYCVYLTNSNKPLRCASGISYDIVIEGYGTYSATALETVISGDYAINILKVDADIGELINVRNVKIHVTYAGSGTKVETRGVVSDIDGQYIDVRIGEQQARVYVYVICANDSYALIRAKDENDTYIAWGVEYWIPRLDVIESIKELF